MRKIFFIMILFIPLFAVQLSSAHNLSCSSSDTQVDTLLSDGDFLREELTTVSGSADTTIDVLVVYTRSARNSLDENDNLLPREERAKLREILEEESEKINRVLANSGLGNREINIVGMEEIGVADISMEHMSYSENACMENDLLTLIKNPEHEPPDENAVVETENITLDRVHQLRKQYGVDFVHLLVTGEDTSNSNCGFTIPYNLSNEELITTKCSEKAVADCRGLNDTCPDPTNDPMCNCDADDIATAEACDTNACRECVSATHKAYWSAKNAFSVSAIEQACRDQYAFVHEMGHSMGIFHDRGSSNSEQALSVESGSLNFPYKRYGFGYDNLNALRSSYDRCWRTVVTPERPNHCATLQSFMDDKIELEPYFSNPNINISSTVGVSPDDMQVDEPAGKPYDDEQWSEWDNTQRAANNGPAYATRAIDETWDFLANLVHSSTSCENKIFRSLNRTISVPVAGRQMDIILRNFPELCANEDGYIFSSFSDFIIASQAQDTGTNSRTVSIEVKQNDTCEVRKGELRFRFSLGVSNPSTSIMITQAASAIKLALCTAIPDGGSLSDITDLNLSNRSITKIESFDFDSLTGLENLNLSQNNIYSIGDDVFTELGNLIELDLSENQIRSLGRHVFLDLDSLEQLNLSENQIRSINEYAFTSLNNLKTLDLSQNELEYIDLSVFEDLTSVEDLDLSENEIGFLLANTFTYTTELKYLWMSHNEIDELSSGDFKALTKLRSLALDNNEIERLPYKIFNNLSSLRYLWLNANALETLPATVFDSLNRLRYLNLSFNNLTTALPDDVCTFIKGVRRLVIQGIDINVICPPSVTTSQASSNEGGLIQTVKRFLGGGFSISTEDENDADKSSFGDSEDALFFSGEETEKVIQKMYEDGIGFSEISDLTGVNIHKVSRIISNEMWNDSSR